MDKKKTKQIREEFKQLESPNARLIDKQMEIAAQISRYIRQLGINQKELAQKADIGESQLSEILRGEANPTLKTLVKIEAALDCDIVVAPAFYEEEMARKGFINLSAGHVETIQMETFSKSVIGISEQVFYEFNQEVITFEEDHQVELEEREQLPLAS
jgi:transcriptional regulator with XRE-family HTH domain